MIDKDKLCVYCKNELQIDPYYKDIHERIKHVLPLTDNGDYLPYTCIDCKGLTEDEEIKAIEEYNNKFNETISNRKVTNLITCTNCNGKGGFVSTICDPPYSICNNCEGKKYVPYSA